MSPDSRIIQLCLSVVSWSGWTQYFFSRSSSFLYLFFCLSSLTLARSQDYIWSHSKHRSNRLHIRLMKPIKLPTHSNHCCVSYINLLSGRIHTEEASPTPFRMSSLDNFLMLIFTAYYTMYNTRIPLFILCNHMIDIGQSWCLKPTDVRFHFTYIIMLQKQLLGSKCKNDISN